MSEFSQSHLFNPSVPSKFIFLDGKKKLPIKAKNEIQKIDKAGSLTYTIKNPSSFIKECDTQNVNKSSLIKSILSIFQGHFGSRNNLSKECLFDINSDLSDLESVNSVSIVEEGNNNPNNPSQVKHGSKCIVSTTVTQIDEGTERGKKKQGLKKKLQQFKFAAIVNFFAATFKNSNSKKNCSNFENSERIPHYSSCSAINVEEDLKYLTQENGCKKFKEPKSFKTLTRKKSKSFKIKTKKKRKSFKKACKNSKNKVIVQKKKMKKSLGKSCRNMAIGIYNTTSLVPECYQTASYTFDQDYGHNPNKHFY